MSQELRVPPRLRRGALRSDENALVESGRYLMDLMLERVGLASYEGVEILDVGCGNKMTQAILKHDIPVKRYVGIDIHRDLMEYLRKHVTDSRFEFYAVDYQNDMYNPSGTKMTPDTELPCGARRFDLVCLFSVFTHLAPDDFESMLRILRRYVHPNGHLFFSTFIDLNATQPFRDVRPDDPLKLAFYSEALVRELVDKAGWDIQSLHPRQEHIQHHLVCTLRPDRD